MLWTSETAAKATGGKAQGSWQAARVEIDSRRVRPGDLFVAIKGERFDGHDYVADAFANGAVAAIISSSNRGEAGRGAPHGRTEQASPPPNLPPIGGGKLLVVDDTFKALEALGRAGRQRSRAKVIGITGSVGKTSAKEMLRIALAAHGSVFAGAGNFNNHIGTPLNLANLPPEVDFAVFEMGMNHAGEIAQLTRQVMPHIVVITNVEAVHMEFFPSVEAIAQAKSEIFEGVTVDGVAVLNRDSVHYALMEKRARACGIKHLVTFGAHEDADCRLMDYGIGGGGSHIVAEIHGKVLHYTLAAIGKHWALASLLTLAVTHALELSDTKTATALEAFGELDGRGKVISLSVHGGEVLLIDDSYNASPAAMRAAFIKTAEVWENTGGTGRRIAALGDMLELGPQGPALHRALAEDIKGAGFDSVFTAGALMQYLHDALRAPLAAVHVAKSMELLPLLRAELKPGDILLVKGSHGSRIYELAKALQDVKSSAAEETRNVI